MPGIFQPVRPAGIEPAHPVAQIAISQPDGR